jgi:hypothetical protein
MMPPTNETPNTIVNAERMTAILRRAEPEDRHEYERLLGDLIDAQCGLQEARAKLSLCDVALARCANRLDRAYPEEKPLAPVAPIKRKTTNPKQDMLLSKETPKG